MELPLNGRSLSYFRADRDALMDIMSYLPSNQHSSFLNRTPISFKYPSSPLTVRSLRGR